MKKLLFSAVVLSFICLPLFVSADIIMSDTHPVSGKVALINLDKFPDYSFIGYVTGPMSSELKPYLIKEGEPLTAGYKFNQLYIYAVKKEKLTNQVIAQISADWLYKNKAVKTKESLRVYLGYVSDSDPTNYEEIYYSVNAVTNNDLVISKYKQVTRYDNGQPEKVEYFQGNQPLQKPIVTPTRRNFFQKFICFFRPLFGKSCSY